MITAAANSGLCSFAMVGRGTVAQLKLPPAIAVECVRRGRTGARNWGQQSGSLCNGTAAAPSAGRRAAAGASLILYGAPSAAMGGPGAEGKWLLLCHQYHTFPCATGALTSPCRRRCHLPVPQPSMCRERLAGKRPCSTRT